MRHGNRTPNHVSLHRVKVGTAALIAACIAGPANATEFEVPLPEPMSVNEMLKELKKRSVLTTPWIPGSFHLATRGVSYKHELKVGERPVKLRVQGPVMNGGVGLRFQVKF